jgi:uncharacterized membrane protein YwzB
MKQDKSAIAIFFIMILIAIVLGKTIAIFIYNLIK